MKKLIETKCLYFRMQQYNKRFSMLFEKCVFTFSSSHDNVIEEVNIISFCFTTCIRIRSRDYIYNYEIVLGSVYSKK